MHFILVINKTPCFTQLCSILFSKIRINLTKDLLTTPNKITIKIKQLKARRSDCFL
jgi:hypothetical protein